MALTAVGDLFRALNQAGVSYCHWKSNVRLEQALSGQTDLDLLVDPDHSHAFRRILDEHDVKLLVAAPGKAYPAMENYLGFDPAGGGLFHLHVHYQLVLGERFVKNYRLPLEKQFLASVRMRHGVATPAPELELIVLCLRMLLKYRDRDAVKDILAIRKPGLPAHILEEIRWLLEQTTPARVSQTLQAIGQIVPAGVIRAFLQLVTTTPRDGRQLFRLRRRARRALRPYRRQSRLRASLKYFREVWHRRKPFLKPPKRKMTLPDGGRTLAVVGADGAGKSTMCPLLHAWLSWKLDTHFYYLGSKQPSRRSRLLYILFRMSRRAHRSARGRLGETSVPARFMAAVRRALRYTHYLSLGYDRYRRYRAGRDKAAAGSIVIYDRYPLAAPLDGPKIQWTANGDTGRLTRAFARLEQRIYDQIGPPDTYILLDVSPDISLQRKPEHDRSAIETKSRLLRELAARAEQKPEALNLHCLDADQPFDAVVKQLKATVWQELA